MPKVNMSKALKNPPIIECLIEVFISKSFDWNANDQIKNFYEKELEAKYPKDRSLEENQFEFRIEGGAVTNNFSASKRYRFLTKDEKSLVQISNDYCVFNQLKPYPKSFDSVLKKALPIFDSYTSFTSARVSDRKIKAIGVRYINEIKISAKQNISEILKIYPSLGILGWQEAGKTAHFAMQVKAPNEDYDIVVNLNHISNSEWMDTYQ